jgi:hypothetical protein
MKPSDRLAKRHEAAKHVGHMERLLVQFMERAPRNTPESGPSGEDAR